MNKKFLILSAILVLGLFVISGCGMIDDGVVGKRMRQMEEVTPPVTGEEAPSGSTCRIPESGMVMEEDTTLCPGIYDLEEGISFLEGVSGVTLTCDGTVLVGPASNVNGISVVGGQYNAVEGCTLTGWVKAIYFMNTGHVNLVNNNLYQNSHAGISLDCDNNIGGLIANNIITENDAAGIAAFDCNSITIIANTLNNNHPGLFVANINDAEITGNIANDNLAWGFWLQDLDGQLILHSNTACNNQYDFKCYLFDGSINGNTFTTNQNCEYDESQVTSCP